MKYKVAVFLLAVWLAGAGSISFLGGRFYPNAGSDIWDINFENLILSKKNFESNVGYLEWEWGKRTITFFAGATLSGRKTINTEYRDYVWYDGSPITQSITYKNNPTYLGIRFYPIPVYRKGILPFVGAGITFVSWEWTQTGEFIDFSDPTLPIYYGDYFKRDSSAGFFINGGLVIKIDRSIGFRIMGFYTSVHGNLEPTYLGFEPIDLSGFTVLAGISIFRR